MRCARCATVELFPCHQSREEEKYTHARSQTNLLHQQRKQSRSMQESSEQHLARARVMRGALRAASEGPHSGGITQCKYIQLAHENNSIMRFVSQCVPWEYFVLIQTLAENNAFVIVSILNSMLGYVQYMYCSRAN